MLHRCYPGLTVIAIGGMLLAGCASAPRAERTQAGRQRSQAAAQTAETNESGEVDPDLVEAHAHYTMGMIHDADDEPELALQEFSKAALADPANEELVLDLSRRYLQRKQPEQALEVLSRAASVPNASGAVFARLGLVHSRLGKDEEAVQASRTAIKRSPLWLTGYQNLFLIHLQKNRIPEALAVLEEARKQPGTGAEFLIDLAELYTNLQRQAPTQRDVSRAGAKEALQRAAKLNPPGAPARLRLADGFNLLGDTTNAAPIYLDLLRRFGDAANLREDVRAKLADIYMRGNEPDKACEQLEGMVRDNPANARAYYFLGSLAYEAKKMPEAEDYYQKALVLGDDFEQGYYDLAGVQISLDHAKAALDTLKKAQAKFRENFMNEFLIGLAYNREKDFTNAVIHYTSAELLARASEPKRLSQYFYFQAGSAYERKGDFDGAEQYFGKALELSPDFPEALNYFGYMLADRGVKLDRAREMIEKAVKLEPKNPAYLDSLGWVLYKMKEPGEALPQILKAVELTEEADATLYDHLGDVYAALHETEKAREAWRKSLTVEPNEQIKKKLEPPN
ncbi:MAG: Tetratricopeptide 2 repeat protein [Pedosphaera sp.]|nr:Tetratricopeptide 2 repeat protein [Pedosphaera sp.]